MRYFGIFYFVFSLAIFVGLYAYISQLFYPVQWGRAPKIREKITQQEPIPPKPAPDPEFSRIVAVQIANLRKNPTKKSRIVKKIIRGDEITIIRTQADDSGLWGLAREYNGWILLSLTAPKNP